MKKHLFAIVAIAATLFASCSKEGNNENVENGPDKKVTMKISGVQTRATDAEAIGEKPAILNDGYIVFTTTSGQLTKVVKFGASETITAANLLAGTEVTQVPGASTVVYVFGNVPSTISVPSTGSISAIQELLVNASTQADNTVGVDRVGLYGTGGITGTTAYTATFDIMPIAARVEITSIAPKSGSDLVSFDVVGIYVNNYFLTERLDGQKNTAAGNGLVHNGTGNADVYDGSKAPYSTSSFLFDQGLPLSAPAAGKRWAYNVFAPSDNNAESVHIIIRLNNIVGDEGTYSGTQFVTIKKFRNKSTTAILDYLSAGSVYELGDIKISEEHLSEVAEDDVKTVTVDANVKKWVPVAVDPVM